MFIIMSSKPTIPSPVSTRSSSSASIKSAAITKSDPLHDILKEITGIRASQDKLMSSHKELSRNVNLRFDQISSRFDSMLSEFTELRNKVNILESKILKLESSSSDVPSLSFSNVVQEFTERDRCKSNIIVHGIPESTSADLSTKINDDKKVLKSVFSKILADPPKDFKPIRLGKFSPSSTSSRPIKVIFGSHSIAGNILSAYRSAKAQSMVLEPLFSIVRDKTPLEREQLRNCHRELECRTVAGESDLTISFKNGSPRVVPKNGRRFQRE